MFTNMISIPFFPYQAAVWVGISAYHASCTVMRWMSAEMNPWWIPVEFVAGLFVSRQLWVASEYIGHRYLLHGPLYDIYHRKHHDSPIDPDYMAVPGTFMIPAAAVYYTATYVCLGANITHLLWIFLPCHYLFFEWLHWRTHQPVYDEDSLLYMVKLYHQAHHRTPTVRYGISSPMGDFWGDTV
jgi:hypothetical protein